MLKISKDYEGKKGEEKCEIIKNIFFVFPFHFGKEKFNRKIIFASRWLSSVERVLADGETLAPLRKLKHEI